jgi:hypothetical protein
VRIERGYILRSLGSSGADLPSQEIVQYRCVVGGLDGHCRVTGFSGYANITHKVGEEIAGGADEWASVVFFFFARCFTNDGNR